MRFLERLSLFGQDSRVLMLLSLSLMYASIDEMVRPQYAGCTWVPYELVLLMNQNFPVLFNYLSPQNLVWAEVGSGFKACVDIISSPSAPWMENLDVMG
jgi:hypothetical protein